MIFDIIFQLKQKSVGGYLFLYTPVKPTKNTLIKTNIIKDMKNALNI